MAKSKKATVVRIKSSINLTEDANKLLLLLMEKHNRSASGLIEVLIKEAAAKEKIKVPKGS